MSLLPFGAAPTPVMTGDSGSGGKKGSVPVPPSGSYASGYFLNAGGSWSYVDQSHPRNADFAQVASITQLVGGGHSQNTYAFTHSNGKNYALVSGGGTTGTLELYDITDQNLPVLINNITLSGTYNATAFIVGSSTYALVPSSGASTVIVVNITNPYSWTTVFTKQSRVLLAVFTALYILMVTFTALPSTMV